MSLRINGFCRTSVYPKQSLLQLLSSTLYTLLEWRAVQSNVVVREAADAAMRECAKVREAREYRNPRSRN